jgi:hypothetical protein
MEDNIQNSVSRSYLESLSTGELIKIADEYGIDVPVGLERIFIIEEILESAQSLSNNSNEHIINEDIKINLSGSETAPLPKQYNISFIDVIIRDPLWVFVFWEIKKHERESHENAADFNGYFLRIIPVNEGEAEQRIKENSFTVSIGVEDNARYLGFSEYNLKNSGHFIIKLGVIRGDFEFPIASSQVFSLPKLYDNEKTSSLSHNPLINLSGIHDLLITKNTDRNLKGKRQ